jgi:hypothetical protein
LATVGPEGIDRVQQLTLGDGHACVLRTDGTVWCWGDDTFNQILGKQNQAPAPIGLPGKATRVAAGLHHTCVLLAEGGEVACWGRDDHGQSGGSSGISKIRVAESTTARTSPIRTLAMTEVIERYELVAGPTPDKLEGTEWSACATRSPDVCPERPPVSGLLLFHSAVPVVPCCSIDVKRFSHQVARLIFLATCV